MMSIVLRTLKDRRWSIMVYVAVGVLFLWMYVAMFPTFADKADQFKQLMNAYPESMMDAFGVKDAAKMFENVENFLAMENYSFLWPILAIALAVSVGGYSIAGEIEQKTIETLLSQPVSRTKIFFAKYLSGAAILALFSSFSIMSIVPLAKLHNVDYNLSAHWKTLLLCYLFAMTIFSIATLFSSMSSEKSRAYFFTVGIVVVMYALNIVASLKDSLSDLKYGSFFYYFNTSKALTENALDPVSIWVFACVIVATTALSVVIFNRRNIVVA